MAESDYQRANDLFRIEDAYLLARGEQPGYGKMRCPFGGVFHKDERVLSIFPDTNSAFCWLSCGYLSSVKMLSMAKDLSTEDAVAFALEYVGYKELTPTEVWDWESSYVEAVDKDALTEALGMYCRRICPEWEEWQLEGDVARVYGKCIRALDKVTGASSATQWLDKTKQVMQTKIEKYRQELTGSS